jgi:hypothetical protein
MGGGAFEYDMAVPHDVEAVRDGEGDGQTLFNQQDGDPFGSNSPQQTRYALDHLR